MLLQLQGEANLIQLDVSLVLPTKNDLLLEHVHFVKMKRGFREPYDVRVRVKEVLDFANITYTWFICPSLNFLMSSMD